MPHRIEVEAPQADSRTELRFEGVLDADGVEALRLAAASAARRGREVRIVLRRGTELDRCCLPALRGLPAELAAESPYLARWLVAGGAP